MKKYLLIGILIILSLSVYADLPSLIESNDGLQVVFQPENLQVDSIYYNQKVYLEFLADNSAVYPYSDFGQPAIICRKIDIGIPEESEFSYEVIDVDYVEFSDGLITPILPVSNTEITESMKLEISDDYKLDATVPEKSLFFDGFYHIRDMRIARFMVPLVRFNPISSKIEVLKKIKFDVRYNSELIENNDNRPDQFEKILKRDILNYYQAKNYTRRSSVSSKNLSDIPFDQDLNWWRIRFKRTGIYSISFDRLLSESLISESTEENEIHFYSARPLMLPTSPSDELPPMLEIGPLYIDNGDGNFGSGDKFVFPAFGPWDSYLKDGYFEGYYNFYDTLNTLWIGVGDIGTAATRADIVNFVPGNYSIFESGWVYNYQKQENKIEYGTNSERWYWDEYDRFSVFITDPTRVNSDESPNLFIRYDPTVASVTVNDDAIPLRTDSRLPHPGRSVYGGDLSGISSDIEGTYRNETLFISYEYMYNINLIPKAGELRFACFPDSVMSSTEGFRYNLSNFSERPYVFDITDFESGRMMEVKQDGDIYYFFDTLENRQYYAVTTDGMREMSGEFVSEPEFSLRDNSRGADYIIITPEHFNLEEFKDHKESFEGMDVEIVYLEDVIREFGYGNPDPTAVREFLRYAYNNWSTAPSYAITIGDGHFDVFHKLTSKKIQFPIPLGADRKTDEFFGCFASSESQIMMARWPVNSQEEVDIITDKIVNYQKDPVFGLWRRTVLTISDDEYYTDPVFEGFRHIQNQSELWEDYIPSSIDPNPIYPVEYQINAFKERPDAAEAYVEEFNQGALTVNFSGHGSAIRWAHESLMKLERDIPRLNNGEKLPFVSSFSCFVSKYFLDWTECIGEELIRRKGGGSIATLASTWGSSGTSNRLYNRNLYSNLFLNEGLTIGQASYLAKGGQYPHHDSQYMLFGDPSMKLAYPEYEIALEMPDTFTSGQLFEIEGTIVDSEDNQINDFNGTVRIKARDSDFMKYYATSIPSAAGSSTEYWQPGKMIFDGEANVENGRFSLAFIVPSSVSDSTFGGSILAYANSDDADAIGFGDTIAVFKGVSDTTDQNGPSIEISFNSRDNSGDRICKNTNLIIDLDDDHGIDITGSVGRKIVLILDEDNLLQIDLTDRFVYNEGSYTSGSIEFSLEDLDIGHHTMTIIASDNLGNTSDETFDFEVDDCEDGLFDVVPYPSPFKDDCHFTFTIGSEAEIDLTIYTQSGRKVTTVHDNVIAPFAKVHWDGNDSNGNPVGNGTYIYHIEADFGNAKDTFTGKIARLK